MSYRLIVSLSFLFCLFLSAPAYAEQTRKPVSVEIDGDVFSYEQSSYQIANDRILVPFEHLFTLLGTQYHWDEKTQTVTATKGEQKVTVTIDKPQAMFNGKKVNLSPPAQIILTEPMVPLRAVSEALGAKVIWDKETRTAMVDIQPKKLGIIGKDLLPLAANGKAQGFLFELGTPRKTIEQKWGTPTESYYYEGGEFFMYKGCNCSILYNDDQKASIFWLNATLVGNVKTADVRNVIGKPRWEEENPTHSGYLMYYPSGKNSLMFHSASKNGTINSLKLSDRYWH